MENKILKFSCCILIIIIILNLCVMIVIPALQTQLAVNSILNASVTFKPEEEAKWTMNISIETTENLNVSNASVTFKPEEEAKWRMNTSIETTENLNVCYFNKTIVFVGDSHIRFFYSHVISFTNCKDNITKANRWGSTFYCYYEKCKTRFVFIWSVAVLPLEKMLKSENCTFNLNDKILYTSNSMQMDFTHQIKKELMSLSLQHVDFLIINLPQIMFSMEGLHDGVDSRTIKVYTANYSGCISYWIPQIINSYWMVYNLTETQHSTILIHHLDLNRWGGIHLETMFFANIANIGIHIIRMQDVWHQTSPDSHMRDTITLNVLAYRVHNFYVKTKP